MAAWDENVGTAEVVALIARMVADGQLESTVGTNSKDEHSMSLRLKASRSSLNGHEKALVDKLFFNDRTETSTSAVRSHYKTTGFNPATEIEPELTKAVDAIIAPGKKKRFSLASITLLLVGIALVMYQWFEGYPGGFALLIPMGIVTLLGWIGGLRFRSYLHWGHRAAALCLLPALAAAISTAWYLWFYAGAKLIELAPLTAYGIASIALACVLSLVNSMKSRRSPSAIAFRKTLTAGREFFLRELGKDRPALRNEWYPWLLGLELSKHVDAWTTQRLDRGFASSHSTTGATSRSSESPSFTGFGGGRSGGAGASASWYAAASGMAASVSPPSSSGSSGGSSGGGSSSGGSSGGGGGGGW